MIWKSEHITAKARNSQNFVHKLVSRQPMIKTKCDGTFNVGIVGAGPKGLYALEELFRILKNEKLRAKCRVFWWNENQDFGSGPNYQPNQPDHLLINYCIGHIDAWDRASHQPSEHLNLMDWIIKHKKIKQEVQPTDFASRALVGIYLQHVLMQVVNLKPKAIELYLIPEKVSNVHTMSNDNLLVETDFKEYEVNNLLFTTGHCYHNIPLINFKRKKIPENYILSAYPIEVLRKIPSDKSVGIIGWGLTFIDVALSLTEGRGGKFNAHGKYIANGNEPVLFPFSRNQLPIMPRGPIYGDKIYRLQYLNKNWLQTMQSIAKKRKLDFRNDIFPWIEREVTFAYYSTFLQTQEKQIIENYVKSLSEEERFNVQDFFFPKVPKTENVQNSYIQYLEFLIAEAVKGELKSPLMAAAAVWREVSPLVAELYKESGFTGDSHRYLDKELFGAFCRTSYGPPIANMKKILALMKADIIQTHWWKKVEIIYKDSENKFLLRSENAQKKVDFIVDARIARPNLAGKNSKLYQNLQENNLVKPLDNEGYQPGIVEMTYKGKVANSGKKTAIYFYGANTEGFLLDNDSLSRKKNNLAPYWADETLTQYLNFTSINRARTLKTNKKCI